jgi:hypothetical protein
MSLQLCEQQLWIEGGPKAHKHEWMDLESQTVGE